MAGLRGVADSGVPQAHEARDADACVGLGQQGVVNTKARQQGPRVQPGALYRFAQGQQVANRDITQFHAVVRHCVGCSVIYRY